MPQKSQLYVWVTSRLDSSLQSAFSQQHFVLHFLFFFFKRKRLQVNSKAYSHQCEVDLEFRLGEMNFKKSVVTLYVLEEVCVSPPLPGLYHPFPQNDQ